MPAPRDCVVAALLAMTMMGGTASAVAADKQDCVPAAVVLWGDGRHDDTQALNAWFDGHNAIWGDSGAPVGASIAGRRFRLSSALVVPGGRGRTLRNFHLSWPSRGETVAGGAIRSGADPNRPPVITGVTIDNGYPGEGRPYQAPDTPPAPRPKNASCAIS